MIDKMLVTCWHSKRCRNQGKTQSNLDQSGDGSWVKRTLGRFSFPCDFFRNNTNLQLLVVTANNAFRQLLTIKRRFEN